MTPATFCRVTMIAAALAATSPALAQAPGCAGRNLMTALEASDPALIAEVRKVAANAENGKHLLYKVESTRKGSVMTSYLFGALQVSDERGSKISPKVTEALFSSRRIAIEIEDGSLRRVTEAMRTMNKSLTLEDGRELRSMLSDAEIGLTAKALVRTGLPTDVLSRARPWVANVMMATLDCEYSRQRAGKLPHDLAMARMAEQRGIGIMGLETVEQLFASLASLPDAEQLAVLKAEIALQDRANDFSETMVQLYVNRDLGAIWPLRKALARKAGADAESIAKYEENVMDSRNRRMIARAYASLLRGGVFMAVGATQLPGKTGLVELLKESGFTVTAIE